MNSLSFILSRAQVGACLSTARGEPRIRVCLRTLCLPPSVGAAGFGPGFLHDLGLGARAFFAPATTSRVTPNQVSLFFWPIG